MLTAAVTRMLEIVGQTFSKKAKILVQLASGIGVQIAAFAVTHEGN